MGTIDKFAGPTAQGMLDLGTFCFYLLFSPPYRPRELFGPNVRMPKCGITLWGALGLSLGPSRPLLGSPWDPPRGPCVHNAPPPKHADISCRFADLCFFIPFRCMSHLFTKPPLLKNYKKKSISTVFEIAISVSFS